MNGWRWVRLDWVATEIRDTVAVEGIGSDTVFHYSIPVLDETGDGQVEPVEDIGSNKTRLSGGEVLISKLNPRIARVVVAEPHDMPTVCSGEFVILRPQNIDARFLFWLLLSETTRQALGSQVQSVTRSQQRARPDDVTKMWIRVPSLGDQRGIADYLDAETSAMDNLLGKKRRLVDLLQERIDSAIMALVGQSALVDGDGGLRAMPVRRRLAKLDRPAEPDAHVVTAFRDGQVTARFLRRSEGFTESWTEGARLQGVSRDDVVVHGLDGFAGAIGTAEVDGVCSPVYHVCSPIDGGDAQFYGRMLRLLATTGYLGNFATSTRERAVDFRNWDLFGRIPIPVVEAAEQRQIGDRIRRLAPIRARVALSETRINERKHALITAAVTGQLGIPGVAA